MNRRKTSLNTDAAQDQKALSEHLLFKVVYTWDQNDYSSHGE